MINEIKVASFTVHATDRQRHRWRRAATSTGHKSIGTWLAEAANAYLHTLERAGLPLPLAWHRGRFKVTLTGGQTIETKGFLSPPFGAFRGTAADGPGPIAWQRYTLVYLPTSRVLATLKTYQQTRALAADLARVWVRWDGVGDQPAEDSAAVLERHRREAL